MIVSSVLTLQSCRGSVVILFSLMSSIRKHFILHREVGSSFNLLPGDGKKNAYILYGGYLKITSE